MVIPTRRRLVIVLNSPPSPPSSHRTFGYLTSSATSRRSQSAINTSQTVLRKTTHQYETQIYITTVPIVMLKTLPTVGPIVQPKMRDLFWFYIRFSGTDPKNFSSLLRYLILAPSVVADNGICQVTLLGALTFYFMVVSLCTQRWSTKRRLGSTVTIMR
jgi:hypothetical protein